MCNQGTRRIACVVGEPRMGGESGGALDTSEGDTLISGFIEMETAGFKISSSRRMFSNSRRRIRLDLQIPQNHNKKRKVNLAAARYIQFSITTKILIIVATRIVQFSIIWRISIMTRAPFSPRFNLIG